MIERTLERMKRIQFTASITVVDGKYKSEEIQEYLEDELRISFDAELIEWHESAESQSSTLVGLS